MTTEKEIANLDEWQKKAALEVPDGPQRIRGLAGTGKTIVLALKAAYLHTQYPDWNILITFYTRSLRQQYVELIEKFVNDFSGEKPDWDHLNVLHSWGSQAEDGVYYRLAKEVNAPIHTFSSAINQAEFVEVSSYSYLEMATMLNFAGFDIYEYISPSDWAESWNDSESVDKSEFDGVILAVKRVI